MMHWSHPYRYFCKEKLCFSRCLSSSVVIRNKHRETSGQIGSRSESYCYRHSLTYSLTSSSRRHMWRRFLLEAVATEIRLFVITVKLLWFVLFTNAFSNQAESQGESIFNMKEGKPWKVCTCCSNSSCLICRIYRRISALPLTKRVLRVTFL